MTVSQTAPHSPRVVLFGARGLIGSHVLRTLQKNNISVHTVPFHAFDASYAERVLRPWCTGASHVTVLFANGLTQASLAAPELLNANVEMPLKWIDWLTQFKQVQCITLGSVMENFDKACDSNRYLGTKRMLFREVQNRARTRPGQLLHLRLHTVYGVPMRPYMFLGQMITALNTHSVFRMSSGHQLREYHHAEDVSLSLLSLIQGGIEGYAPLEHLNSGRPIALSMLAYEVFRFFDALERLQIGALPDQAGENYAMHFPRSHPALIGHDREPISGVIRVVEELLRLNFRS